MELRIPSGAGLLDSLLRDTTTPSGLVGGDAVVVGVTPAQLDDAIAGLERGDIEYLGLHDGGAFVQVAGDGGGPYQLELNPGRVEDQVRVPGGVSAAGMRSALHGFLVADQTWALPFAWEGAGLGADRPPTGRRRSWFRRG